MTYIRLRGYEGRGPAAQLRHLRLEMFPGNAGADFDLIQVLDVLLHDSVNDTTEVPKIPLIRHQRLLKDFMQHRSVHQGSSSLASRFDAVL